MQHLQATLEQLPWPEMEPPGQLAPYFDAFCIQDALSSFQELADSLEKPQNLEPNQNQNQNSLDWWASSPAPSNSSVSSGDSSLACSISGGKSPRRARGGRRLKAAGNAVAAERYRRKLKGRICGLTEQMEAEERKNARLRGEIERKLVIYREFVELLSRNVHLNDLELAESGLRSLSSVLPVTACCSAGSHRDELDALRCKFERILLRASGRPMAATADANRDQEQPDLHYDFHLDSFTPERRT